MGWGDAPAGTPRYHSQSLDESDPCLLTHSGTILLEELLDPNFENGAILQGFNFNDLAGSSMERVADLDNDGDDEFIIVSRYGKPFLLNNNLGVGFGEAFMIYGNGGNNNINAPRRLTGVQTLNAVGRGSIKGLAFPGIRIPLNATAETTGMTEGISDVTVVEDMDGDLLPEIIFGFPRVESINLGETDTTVQHPELLPDLTGMGDLEYDAYDPSSGWTSNVAQFTRGGVVMVSSHNSNITNENQLNRKFERSIDLHEIGQMFSDMARPSVKPYIIGASPNTPPTGCADCIPGETGDCGGDPENENETEYESWTVTWDVVFDWNGSGRAHAPGGFHQSWTAVPASPPLANPSLHPAFPAYIFYPNLAPCDVPGCEVFNVPFVWAPQPIGPFPCSNRNDVVQWAVDGLVHWTGFYGGLSPEVSIRDFNVGARVMGQEVDDRFGTAVSSDGTWLYISAPRHTATRTDVPLLLTTDRERSGVVYQYRIDTRTSQFAPTRSQLWMEPGLTWPDVDLEGAKGPDATMPVPHQYIIESVGSTRGNPPGQEYDFPGDGCLPPYHAGFGGAQAPAAGSCYQPYSVGTVGYWIDRTPQIVGPHQGSEISFVRNVGDVNDDGIDGFAVGSDKIKEDFTDPSNPTGAAVGGIFIVYSRSHALEGDYLLEDLARSANDPRRLAGVLLMGESNEQNIGRNFDGAGDFNGDTVDDVIVGSERGSFGNGEAIVIFGSRTLLSPEGGFTLDEIVAEGRAIRFIGAAEGDLAGANVAGAGDVDFDGMGDILIAAPNANPLNNPAGAPGAVYLIYGSDEYLGGRTIDLSQVGLSIPGAVFVGRNVGDNLGGGTLQITVNPDLQPTTIHSRGVAALGDLDADGFDDFAIAAMLADPHGKTNAGEIYVLYGGCRSGECNPADTNCDASVNALDIEPFLDLLFEGADPCLGKRGDPFSSGDVNGDGSIDALDIEPFIECLFG